MFTLSPVNVNLYVILLYSWRFSRYSASFHWLVHGHMMSNNETVSRQMPWACNIAKAMTSNGKQFTVDRCCTWWLESRFSNFAFVLFCYITNHLMTGPLGNSEFCFPRISILESHSFMSGNVPNALKLSKLKRDPKLACQIIAPSHCFQFFINY